MEPAPDRRPPVLSPRSRDLLARLASERGISLEALVEALLPLPDDPYEDHRGLILDADGEVRALRLDTLSSLSVRAQPDELVLADLPALEVLSVMGTRLPLRRLSVARAPRLRTIEAGCNGLTALELSDLPALEELGAHESALQEVDLRGLPALRVVNLRKSGLERVLLPPTVRRVHLGENALASIDLAAPELRELRVEGNRLETLELSGCPALETLQCERNRLRALDAGPCPRLKELFCAGAGLERLPAGLGPALELLAVDGNPLRNLDLRSVPGLTHLDCAGCRLKALDLAPVPRLASLECPGNALHVLDLAPVPRLAHLVCGENPLEALDLRPAPGLVRAELPPLPREAVQATELQRRRVPELHALFGARKPPRALKDLDAFELHLRAERWSFDDGARPLVAIVKHEACDLGTALSIYWRCLPRRYLAYRTKKEVPAHERDVWDLVRAIEERAEQGGWRSRLVPFDPRADTTSSAGGEDRTLPGKDDRPPVREIPPVLLEACVPQAELLPPPQVGPKPRRRPT